MIETFFNADIAIAAWPILWRGLRMTVALSLLVVPLGFACGLALALLSTVPSRPLRWALVAWIDLFRAFPPLVLLVFLYAGLPFAGIELGAVGCVAIGFFLNTGAYYAEVIRAGLDSVPPGLSEAARSTGLGPVQTLRFRSSWASSLRCRSPSSRSSAGGGSYCCLRVSSHLRRSRCAWCRPRCDVRCCCVCAA